MLCIKSIETEEVKLMLGVSLIIIAAAAVYMVEAYIHTYYAIEYMHGAPLFFVLLAKYAAPVLFLLLCGYFVFRYMEKRRESEKPVQDKLVNREEAYAEKIYATVKTKAVFSDQANQMLYQVMRFGQKMAVAYSMDYFYGDVEQAKKDYFKYMTWYLATPFMAYLRYFASRNNYDTKLFPMYGVIYGDSNGGKTTFIKFLVKLMCGETVKMSTTEDFTATRIDGLKRVCEGLPLNIDDLAKTQFQNHSERVIKNDEWGISDRLVNYPAVSITSNKITSLTKDLSKRAIICRIGAKIDNERGAKNSKRVNESMSELTTAFYGEYVRRMLVCIDEMTTEMRENAKGKEYFPDIFHASSSVIADIFEACGIDLPDYVRILYYNDYMGDESIGRAAIEKIELAWQADPSKFRVDKKQNRLIYSYPPDGPWYELKYIADELPNSLEAEISGGNQLIMNYEQAQELFGIKFRRWLGIFNL